MARTIRLDIDLGKWVARERGRVGYGDTASEAVEALERKLGKKDKYVILPEDWEDRWVK